MTWESLSSLGPLRDEHGLIVLEEADDDTRTATFRVYGRGAVTATVSGDEVQWAGDAPPPLRAAVASPKSQSAPLKGTVPPLSRDPDLVSPRIPLGTVPLRWVGAGLACAGIAVIAARRRR